MYIGSGLLSDPKIYVAGPAILVAPAGSTMSSSKTLFDGVRTDQGLVTQTSTNPMQIPMVANPIPT